LKGSRMSEARLLELRQALLKRGWEFTDPGKEVHEGIV